MTMSNRDNSIDFLRFLGFSLIILAHVQAPYSLTQLRCFDVPLMVFVSGLTAAGKDIKSYAPYIYKRTKRLIIPVWLFLAFYLTFFYVIQFKILPEQYLTGEMILRSFLLQERSIGYVWIIRVFLIIMIVTPLLLRLVNKLKSICAFSTAIIIFLCLAEAFYCLANFVDNNFISIFISDYLIYGIAYSVPFIMGVRFRYCSKHETIIMIGILTILFFIAFPIVISEGNGLIDISSKYKTPPRFYYTIYGTLISLILWLTKNSWNKIAEVRIFKFIGRNTIWLYLWHMPFALLCGQFLHQWWLRYIAIYFAVLMIFGVQYKIVTRVNNRFTKYLIG